MDDGWMFLLGAGVLIGYLVLSAMTEMGTKLPGRWDQDRDDPEGDVQKR